MSNPDLPLLTCPSCNYSAPAAEFVPPKLASQFAERAFVLLTVISVLSMLKWIGVIK